MKELKKTAGWGETVDRREGKEEKEVNTNAE